VTQVHLRPGRHHPLGATCVNDGVNFALFSENATAVTLCLFDQAGVETQLPLVERTAHVWHALVPGIGAGQRYGYRVHGPFDPASGNRFDPNKLVVDPYARLIEGVPDFAVIMGSGDTARGVPKSVVFEEEFPWRGDRPPQTPWHKTVIYEAHVKGTTMRHPGVRREIAGTYLGLASPAVLDHLEELGVTAIELMPVHQKMDEVGLAARGATNYWGYSTLGFFAPDQRFASRPGAEVREFKELVRALHARGLEVLLDVVYNHTCEGDHKGPTVSLRGIDNKSYYRLTAADKSLYEDFTGCGNTLNMTHPQAIKLVMDSLRYWVTEMHVDGLRFDLAPTLAREAHYVDRLSAFFDIVHQDPVLSTVKLIAEPWDLGAGGYQVGNFPVLWTEWNGRFRDTVRSFWTGDKTKLADMGYRLTGSSDLFQEDGRHPGASVNFVTAHDGFTLRDLVSYDKKHNEANGENNRDGADENLSWNCGVEGETTQKDVRDLRARQQRNLLATLLLSQGVPMLLGGDEMGRTQRGNNNAYCQDNALSWTDWELDDERRALLGYAQAMVRLRQAHPVFRRIQFFRGVHTARGEKDITWLRADGREMTAADWSQPAVPAVGMMLAGDGIPQVDDEGEPVVDDTFLVLFSSHKAPVSFVVPVPVSVPRPSETALWTLVVDTRVAKVPAGGWVAGGGVVVLAPYSTVVLQWTP
jgi:glycogen operon protein